MLKTIKTYNGVNYVLLALARATVVSVTEYEIADVNDSYYDFTEILNLNNVNYRELYTIALSCFKSVNILEKINLKRFKKQLEIIVNKFSWLEVDNALYNLMYA